METTIDDVRRPLRLRLFFLAIAGLSVLACAIPFGIGRLLWDVEPRALARAIQGAGLALCGGHAVLALLAAWGVDLAVRRDEEAWARSRGGRVLLLGTNLLNLPLLSGAVWYWDDEGITTVGRARHAWSSLLRVTTTKRRADTVLNALWNYTVVYTDLAFQTGAARAALHTSAFAGALGRRRQEFTDAVLARVQSVAPMRRETRGVRWRGSEEIWSRPT
jgi:hypothetical protein